MNTDFIITLSFLALLFGLMGLADKLLSLREERKERKRIAEEGQLIKRAWKNYEIEENHK